MAIFNSKLLVYQRVPLIICLLQVAHAIVAAASAESKHPWKEPAASWGKRHATLLVGQHRLCDSVGYLGISPTHVIEFHQLALGFL